MPETRELSVQQCEALLRIGIAGRVAISTPTGPHMVPVNYTVVDDAIVVRTSPYSLLGTHGRDTMIAFGIDGFDPEQERGWSVQARGRVEVVTTRKALDRIREVADPSPWANGVRSLVPAAALDRAERPPARRQLGPGARRAGEYDVLSTPVVPHTGDVSPDRPTLSGAAEALFEAVTAISSDLDLRSVLTRLVESATRLTGAQYAAMGVIGGSGDDLVEFVTTGIDEEQHRPDRRPAPRPGDPGPADPRAPGASGWTSSPPIPRRWASLPITLR